MPYFKPLRTCPGGFCGCIGCGALGLDVEIATTSGRNVAENNAFFLAPIVITAAKILWEIYSITYEKEIQQTKQEVCKMVADRLGYDVQVVEMVVDAVMMGGSLFKMIKTAGKQGFQLLMRGGIQRLMQSGVSSVEDLGVKLSKSHKPQSIAQTEKPFSKKRLASANDNLHRDRSVEGLDLAGSRVRKVNGRLPLNSAYAGKIYPQGSLPVDIRSKYTHGVPFNGYGYPDFSRYAIKKVDMAVTGNRSVDNRLANQLGGYKKTPLGYTWHHHQNGQTMMLVPKDIHDAVAHTGGVANLKIK